MSSTPPPAYNHAGPSVTANMALRARRPKADNLHLSVPGPSSQSALFQHSPSPGTTIKKEWEPGCQPNEVYERELSSWRNGLRLGILRWLDWESGFMPAWQKRVRTEARDKFFYWTAIFGTHTFFMTFLPMLFWLGYLPRARGLLHVTALGIWLSSFVKDLACAPRPFSPPMVRLTMSTHAHEYGFPSSHSTNSVSIALYFAQWLLEAKGNNGSTATYAGLIFLAFYVVSVVGGRIYTGMHSLIDIAGGSLLGVACWAIWYALEERSEAWVNSGSWTGMLPLSENLPYAMLPATLAAVHFHPQPVDDCPCFEDAIAVLAVVLGTFMGHWYWARQAVVQTCFERSYMDESIAKGAIVGLLRIVVGIAMIFPWRIAAKAILLRILPPIFRATSVILDVELPARKHYRQATSDYTGVPPTPIRSMPSFIDLHAGTPPDLPSAENTPTTTTSNSPLLRPSHPMPRRSSSSDISLNGDAKPDGFVSPVGAGRGKRRNRIDRAKYDAEVLTKVGVYAGIGYLVTWGSPYVFEYVERSLGL